MSLIKDGLQIRPFDLVDGPAFVAAALESVSTVGAWMPWCHGRYALVDAESWIQACARNLESGLSYDLGIFSNDKGELLGGISIRSTANIISETRATGYGNRGSDKALRHAPSG